MASSENIPQNEWWIWVPPADTLRNGPTLLRLACARDLVAAKVTKKLSEDRHKRSLRRSWKCRRYSVCRCPHGNMRLYPLSCGVGWVDGLPNGHGLSNGLLALIARC